MGCEDGADNEHHDGHPDGTGDETLLAAQSVNAEDQEERSGNHLDGAVHSSCEQRRVCAADADCLENLGGVVSDAVGSRKLLPEHDSKSQCEAVPVALLQALLPGNALRKGHLFLDCGSNLCKFLEHLGAVWSLVANVGQRSQSLLVTRLLHEPAG